MATSPPGAWVQEQQLILTLYQRLKLTPQQRQLAGALWKCWSSRRRAHNRTYAAVMRHLSCLLPPASKMPLRTSLPPLHHYMHAATFRGAPLETTGMQQRLQCPSACGFLFCDSCNIDLAQHAAFVLRRQRCPRYRLATLDACHGGLDLVCFHRAAGVPCHEVPLEHRLFSCSH